MLKCFHSAAKKEGGFVDLRKMGAEIEGGGALSEGSALSLDRESQTIPTLICLSICKPHFNAQRGFHLSKP